MSLTLPVILTQDLFPAIYAASIEPDIIYDDVYDYLDRTINLENNPIRSDLLKPYVNPYVNPMYVSGPQKYEYRYQNQNGIDVVIRGTYDHVMSTVDVLNTYPPLIKKSSEKQKDGKQYFGLIDINKKVAEAKGIPMVGQINTGDHMNVIIDKKIYSGSGTLLIVVNKDISLETAKIVLFNNSKKGKYEELGGKIDPLNPGELLDETILFKNAKRESLEESMKLFNISKPSETFVDIESLGTYYRIYVYLFVIDNPQDLERYYKENKDIIYEDVAKQYSDVYKETNDLKLFDYQSFIHRLGKNSSFQTSGNNMKYVNVNDRTIKVLSHLKDHISDMINNKKVSSLSLKLKDVPDKFNVITLN